MKRSPVAYAWPVVPTSVMALICVAITDRPTAHHGSERFAQEVAVDLIGPLRSAQTVVHHPHQIDDDDRPVQRVHASGKQPAKHPEDDENGRLDEHDAHVQAGHLRHAAPHSCVLHSGVHRTSTCDTASSAMRSAWASSEDTMPCQASMTRCA